MKVASTYRISGMGMVAVGVIESGHVRLGDMLELVSGGARRSVRVKLIETFSASLAEASAGPQELGLCLSDLDRGQLRPGDLLTTPQG